MRIGQFMQAHEQMRPQPVHPAYDILLLHDLQNPVEANHVRKIAAPGRVDAARQPEYMIFHLVHLRTGQHAADLGLLSECDQIRAHAERLVRPEPSGNADAGLYFVEDEQCIVLVGQFLQPGEEFRTKVIIPSFSLDGFDDHGGNVVPVRHKMLPSPVERDGFAPLDFFEMRIQRVNDFRVRDARPVEDWKVPGLVGIRRVGERKRVSGTSMERLLQMQHPPPEFTPAPLRPVFANLPVECRLQRILDRRRATGNKERIGQILRNRHATERPDEPGHMHGGYIRIRDFVERRLQQTLPKIHVPNEGGMVHAQHTGSKKSEKVEIFLARGRIAKMYAPAALHVQHKRRHAAHLQMLRQNTPYIPGGYRV